VLCVLLVLFIGVVQAVHVHSENSKLPSHECSICSVAHAGLIRNAIENPAPVLVQTETVAVAAVTRKSSDIVLSFRIRPPPSV
jgi:hypothetical protein